MDNILLKPWFIFCLLTASAFACSDATIKATLGPNHTVNITWDFTKYKTETWSVYRTSITGGYYAEIASNVPDQKYTDVISAAEYEKINKPGITYYYVVGSRYTDSDGEINDACDSSEAAVFVPKGDK
jgi:hypothetical protein